MERDIFEEDPKFGGEKEKEDVSFGQSFGYIFQGVGNLFKGIWQVLLKKFGINLLILLMLLLAVFFGSWYMLKQKAPEPVAANITCPEPQNCSSCCPECPTKVEYINVTQNMIYYKCKDGRLVTSEDECKANYPDISSADVITDNDVTFSIDRLDYSFEGNSSARLSKINYTIINKKDTRIMPTIAVKVYDVWSSEVLKEEPKFFISTGEIVDSENWMQVSKGINIYIADKSNKIRFELRNTLPDPDESIAAIVKTIG